MSGSFPTKIKSALAFLLLVVAASGFAAAPPGVSETYAPSQKTGPAARGAFQLGIGIYNPSLKTLNDDLKAVGMKELDGGLYYSGAVLLEARSNYCFSIGLGYWKGTSAEVNPLNDGVSDRKLGLTLFSANVPFYWSVPLKDKMLYVNPGISSRLNIAYWKLSYADDTYYDAMGGYYYFGPLAALECFPFPGSDSFSLFVGAEYIAFGFAFSNLSVLSSTRDGVEVNDKIVTLSEETMKIEANGLIISFGANLYF